MDTLVVFVTVPSAEKGVEIARSLVGDRLAACVNIIAGVRSIYHWEGKLEDQGEALLIIKSSRQCLKKLEQRVLELHPYETAEFIALSPQYVTDKYAKWLEESL